MSLTGAWKQTPDLNANGIARTPDGRALLVVQSSTGFLFRVNPATGFARRVGLGRTLLTNGDGLLVQRRTLYAVQNQLNKVAVVHLDPAGHPRPAGGHDHLVALRRAHHVARSGRSLYLPNARFSTPPTPTTTYSAFRVTR